ncbi:hypothetical protein EVAR_63868_1 [Eumeta japonica]|uniref:Uncharacterized protein n=1 Tax=Eumeta variegata TaxID=151549 RepID=A0A4C2A2A6_EUMVA|nr:hypothetical protein EVAR_63868_1 [Eumeta japonica]
MDTCNLRRVTSALPDTNGISDERGIGRWRGEYNVHRPFVLTRSPLTALSTCTVNELSQIITGEASRPALPGVDNDNPSSSRCVRPLSLFYSDASADGVEERSLVRCSRSYTRLRRNATKSHAFSCVQTAFIDL